MSVTYTSELLDGVPVVRLRMDTFHKVLEEYFRRYRDGKDRDRKISIVISGETGAVLVMKGALRMRLADEWYPIKTNDSTGEFECKFVDGQLYVRKQYWNKWVLHVNKCASYPSVIDKKDNKICDRDDIVCVVDIIPDDQENYVPGELYESVRA